MFTLKILKKNFLTNFSSIILNVNTLKVYYIFKKTRFFMIITTSTNNIYKINCGLQG